MPYTDLRERRRGGLTQEMMKFNYYRGALIGAAWDYRLRRSGGSLEDMLKAMIRKAQAHDGKLDEESFFEIAQRFGVDARADFERHVIRAEAVTLPVDWAGPGYVLEPRSFPRFDLGFDYRRTSREHRIAGVARASNAYRAGLRDGMEFVGARNANRYANSWPEDEPLVVSVVVNGAPREMAYFPRGPMQSVPQFVRVP